MAKLNERNKYIICSYEIMEAWPDSGALKVNKMYGDLFTAFWNEGRAKFRFEGRIIYARMTPPWLYGNIVFVHGETAIVSHYSHPESCQQKVK